MKHLKFALLAAIFAVLAACGQQVALPENGEELAAETFKTTVAYWHFNTTHTGNTIPSNVGTATLSYEFTSGVASFTGTTLNAREGALAGNDFTVRGGAGLQNSGRSFTLAVPTTGYEGIELHYATRRSPQGFTEQVVCFSTDGSTFPEDQCAIVTPITNTTTSNLWRVQSVDFTGQPGTMNNPNFRIRVTVRDTTGVLDDAGNNRFDNIVILGAPYEPPAPVQPPPVEPGPGEPAPVEPELDNGVVIAARPLKGRMEGFFAPVDRRPDTFNVVRAGSTVPLKFRVFRRTGEEVNDPNELSLRIFSLGNCNPSDQVPLPVEEVTLGGPGAIQYDAANRQFTANWTVPRTTNVCYVVRAERRILGYATPTSTEASFRSR